MSYLTRKVTNTLIERIEEGLISWEEVARECLAYMSEDQVKDMVEWTFWLDGEEEEEDE